MTYQSSIVWVIAHPAVLTQELVSQAMKGIAQCYFNRNPIQCKPI